MSTAIARVRAADEARFPRLREIKTHPALDFIPMMREDEFARLVWSIRKIGQIHPVVQDETGAIVDGRGRILACEVAGVEPRLTPPKDSVACYIFAANTARRHLNVGQRAMIIALMIEAGIINVHGELPTAKLTADEAVHFIFSLNFHRKHLNHSELRILDAMMAKEESDYPATLVLPEARFVAQYDDLVREVLLAGWPLSLAHEHALERQQAAQRATENAERHARLRTEAPFLALQVDEGRLTLDQAVVTAEEQAVAPALAEHADAIRAAGQRVIDDVIEIGDRLAQCKQMLRHGGWLPWLEREFGWTNDTALNFMRVAELSKNRIVRNLSLPVTGLYLLAKPSTPEGVRNDILDRAETGEALSVGDIKQAIDIARGKTPSRMKPVRDRLRDLLRDNNDDDDPLIVELRRMLAEAETAPAALAPADAEVRS